MIKITLRLEGQKFITCNYMWLDPNAPNTGRRFVFSSMQERNNIVDLHKTISVEIDILNRRDKWTSFIQFDIFVFKYDEDNLLNDEWWVYGKVDNIYEEYRQGEMDAFNAWQKDELFNWFNLPVGSHLKLDYINACLFYSGLGTNIIAKDLFHFDMSAVKQEVDFYYLAGLEFVGDRGYFGYDMHTFKDCLLQLYHSNGYFYGKKIVFFNVDKIYNQEIKAFCEDVKNVFLKYKFLIEVLPASLSLFLE